MIIHDIHVVVSHITCICCCTQCHNSWIGCPVVLLASLFFLLYFLGIPVGWWSYYCRNRYLGWSCTTHSSESPRGKVLLFMGRRRAVIGIDGCIEGWEEYRRNGGFCWATGVVDGRNWICIWDGLLMQILVIVPISSKSTVFSNTWTFLNHRRHGCITKKSKFKKKRKKKRILKRERERRRRTNLERETQTPTKLWLINKEKSINVSSLSPPLSNWKKRRRINYAFSCPKNQTITDE